MRVGRPSGAWSPGDRATLLRDLAAADIGLSDLSVRPVKLTEVLEAATGTTSATAASR